MLRKKRIIPLILVSLFTASCSGYNPLGSTGTTTRPESWTEATHSNKALPDYDTVFPDNKVNRIDLTIEPADWKLMQDNMTELFGSGRGGPGGFPGGGGFNPPGGFPGGGPNQSGAVPGPRRTPAPNFTPPDGNMFPGGPPTGGRNPGEGLGGRNPDMEENPVYRPAKLTFEGKTWNYVGVRYKGNSSLRSSWGRTQKLPFRFDFDEFEDQYPAIKNQRFFGFKKLTLSSGFSDDSLIREKVTADIFRAAGVPSARTAFYRLYVDYGEGPKYFGLYTMVEAPDTPMFQTQFKQTGGNLYKPSGTGAYLRTFDEGSFPKKTNEEENDFSDVKALIAALNADRSDSEQWRKGLEKVFDMTGYLKYQAVNTVIQNWDTYGAMAHNYYLYTDPGDNLIHWIPWDNNMALSGRGGGAGFGGPGTPGGMMPPAENNRERMGGFGGNGSNITLGMKDVGENWPLIRYVMDDPVYYARYVSFVKEVINGAFEINKTRQLYQSSHNLIKEFVIGSEGEKEGYTLLSSPEAFEKSLDELNRHLESRHEEAKKFLAEN